MLKWRTAYQLMEIVENFINIISINRQRSFDKCKCIMSDIRSSCDKKTDKSDKSKTDEEKKRSSPDTETKVSRPTITAARSLNAAKTSSSNTSKSAAIKLDLQSAAQKKEAVKRPMVKKHTVESVFNNDSDSDVEEMPPEARMKMRNLGKDTPTSSGPNSFNKGKLGFVNHNKMMEMELKNLGSNKK